MISYARSTSCRWFGDQLLSLGLRLGAACAAAVLLFVVGFVALEAWPALRTSGIAAFLFDGVWRPSDGRFGMAPMLAATALAALGAVLLATPLGVLLGIYGHLFEARRSAALLRSAVELLNGIPSVVFGLFGLTVLVPRIAALRAPGASLAAGILVLAVMILPTIAVSADAAIAAVPARLARGAAALGLDRGTALIKVILPAAARGIGAGVLLAAGRAIGETMAVLMVAGNVVRFPTSPFDPVRTVTANIALEMAYATEAHRSALFVGGMLLVCAIVLCMALVELWRRGRRA